MDLSFLKSLGIGKTNKGNAAAAARTIFRQLMRRREAAFAC
jgi:hypothetical protein